MNLLLYLKKNQNYSCPFKKKTTGAKTNGFCTEKFILK